MRDRQKLWPAFERIMKTPATNFPAFCARVGLPIPTPELEFHAERKWRMDWTWPEYRIALEVDGGIHSGGRHTQGTGRHNDMQKENEAAILGWCVLHVTPKFLCSASTLHLINRAICARENQYESKINILQGKR